MPERKAGTTLTLGKSASDAVHAVDVVLKIAEYVSFVRIIPDMVVQARKNNAMYVGDALNYKRIHTQCQLYHKS